MARWPSSREDVFVVWNEKGQPHAEISSFPNLSHGVGAVPRISDLQAEEQRGFRNPPNTMRNFSGLHDLPGKLDYPPTFSWKAQCLRLMP
jgi:hypothetical protein